MFVISQIFVSSAIYCACQRVQSASSRFGFVLKQEFGPDSRTNTGVNSLQSYEALIGARVKVLETDRRAELRGMFGTIEHRFGHPEYVALDVRLDDGRLELFWAHGLEMAEEAEQAFRA
jgi:hypothetical protein